MKKWLKMAMVGAVLTANTAFAQFAVCYAHKEVVLPIDQMECAIGNSQNWQTMTLNQFRQASIYWVIDSVVTLPPKAGSKHYTTYVYLHS